MSELWPGTGDPWQNGNVRDWNHAYPKVCTTETSYRAFANKPRTFMEYLMKADKCMGGSKGFSSLKDNMTAMPLRVWPMFSIENLSGSKATLESGSRSCLRTRVSGRWRHSQRENGCGTFDGLAYWDWDSFETFLRTGTKCYQTGHGVRLHHDQRFLSSAYTNLNSFLQNGMRMELLAMPAHVNTRRSHVLRTTIFFSGMIQKQIMGANPHPLPHTRR